MPVAVLLQGGVSPGFINLASALGDIYPALNAAGPNDLIFWTQDELYQYFDEAAQRLARVIGCFTVRDTSITGELNVGTYSLPANQVATVQADLAGLVLRARTVRELEALDATWPATVGAPVAFAQDVQGTTEIVIYPACNSESAGETIGLVLHVLPPTLTASTALIGTPICIREYFTFRALGGARGKQSKAEMPEVSAWFGQLGDWMEQIMQAQWGAGQ